MLNIPGGESAFSDLSESWPILLATVFVALALSVLLTFIIKWFAACLVWSVIFLYFATLVGLGFAAFEMARNPDWANK